MKTMRTKVLSIVALFVFGVSAVFAANKTENFKVYGNCEMCKEKIEKAAKAVDGVSSAVWSIETKMLALTFDDSKTSVDKVQVALAKDGHDTETYKATNDAYNKNASCCKYERTKIETKEVDKEKLAPVK
jgi:copper chaperone CopZ